VSRIEADGDTLELVINGDGPPPPLEEYGFLLRTQVDPEITLNLTVVPTQNLRFPDQ
jgi:hypothetical protein